MGGASDGRRRDRAQLILITAVIIAAFVLSAIVLLNLLHESPEFSSDQDGVSIETSERMSSVIYADVHRYFLAHSADRLPGTSAEPDDPSDFQLPYAEPGFGAELSGLSEPYTRAVSQTRPSVTEIRYLSGQSDTGAIVWSNNSRLGNNVQNATPPDSGRFIDDAEALPRLYIDIDFRTHNAKELRIYLDGDVYLTLQEDGIQVHEGEGACGGVTSPYELDLVHGTGEARSSDSGYCRIDLDVPSGSFDVELRGSAMDDTNWEYAISGTNGAVNASNYRDQSMYMDDANTIPNVDVWGDDGVIVDPAFAVAYEDPKIAYETTIDLYREGDG